MKFVILFFCTLVFIKNGIAAPIFTATCLLPHNSKTAFLATAGVYANSSKEQVIEVYLNSTFDAGFCISAFMNKQTMHFNLQSAQGRMLQVFSGCEFKGNEVEIKVQKGSVKEEQLVVVELFKFAHPMAWQGGKLGVFWTHQYIPYPFPDRIHHLCKELASESLVQ